MTRTDQIVCNDLCNPNGSDKLTHHGSVASKVNRLHSLIFASSQEGFENLSRALSRLSTSEGIRNSSECDLGH